jgi:hypothetical protein
MAIKHIQRPRDPLALAKLIGDIATGQVVDAVEDGKNAAAVARCGIGFGIWSADPFNCKSPKTTRSRASPPGGPLG